MSKRARCNASMEKLLAKRETPGYAEVALEVRRFRESIEGLLSREHTSGQIDCLNGGNDFKNGLLPW